MREYLARNVTYTQSSTALRASPQSCWRRYKQKYERKLSRERLYQALKATSLMETGSRAGLQQEQDTDALAQDAVVWASQHGLVSPRG